MPSRTRRLIPLVLATTATQASIVVLAPIVVEIGRDLGASVSAIGLARSVLSGAAVAVSLAIGPLIDRIGVRPLIVRGAGDRLRRRRAHGGGALAAVLLRRPRGDRRRRGLPAVGRVRGGGVARSTTATPRGRWATWWAPSRSPGSSGNPIIGLLADSGSWRLSYAVPAVISLAALAAGLAAPRTGVAVAARGEDASIRAGLCRGLPRPLRAPLDDRRAGGLLGLDRRADLRGRVLRRRTTACRRPPWACCWPAGSVVFLVTSLNTERLTRRVPAPAADRGRLAGDGRDADPHAQRDAVGVRRRSAFFFVLAVFAAVRSTGSSALGLEQLPGAAGQHDGRAHGQRPARLHDRRRRRRPGAGAGRLRHARLRAVRGAWCSPPT